MSHPEILKMQGIHKSFGATHALRGADLSVLPAEVHAIVGSNGAGKSTLMKTLAGIHRPDEGQIWFEGKDIAGLQPLQMQRMGIQVVHQVLNLVGSMSVLENIMLANPPLRLGMLSWRKGAEEARRVLGKIEFPLDLKIPVSALSVSEQQFAILARALIHQPKLLVLDEPTARLGMQETQKLFRLIRTLKAQGTTVLYISHRIEEIYTICDRISVFRDGVCVRTDAIKDFPEAELVQAMLGKKLDVFFPKEDAAIGQEVLAIEGLTLGDKLQGIDLTVRSGEIVSLVGAVGAGKTEILDCLFGLQRADGGKIRIRGKAIGRGHAPRRAVAMGMAQVPEDRALQGMVGPYTVKENATSVDMRLLRRGGLLSKKKEAKLAQQLNDRLDVRPNDINYIMNSLSGGNQQKVVIGKWLTHEYPVYLMDEVTAGVDIEAKAEIYRIIGAITQKGGAVLLATGDIEEAMGISDRVVVLYKGKVVFQAQPADTSKDTLLSYIMGGGKSA